MDDKNQIEDALKNLSDMQRNLASIDRIKNEKILSSTFAAMRFLQRASILLAGLIILVELITEGLLSQLLILSKNNTELRTPIVLFVASGLTLCLFIVYITVWVKARQDGESIRVYISRNLSYLNFGSYLSDIALKFFLCSGIILIGVPEYLVAAMLVCTADHLFQSRFFVLPEIYRNLFGFSTFGLSVIAILLKWTSVTFPIGLFLIFTVVSMIHLKKKELVRG